MHPAGTFLKSQEQHRADQSQPQPEPGGQGARHLDRGEKGGAHVQVGRYTSADLHYPCIKKTWGIVQQLRNAVVAVTSLGKNYGRIMR